MRKKNLTILLGFLTATAAGVVWAINAAKTPTPAPIPKPTPTPAPIPKPTPTPAPIPPLTISIDTISLSPGAIYSGDTTQVSIQITSTVAFYGSVFLDIAGLTLSSSPRNWPTGISTWGFGITPTQVGTYVGTISVADTENVLVSRAFNLTVSAKPDTGPPVVVTSIFGYNNYNASQVQAFITRYAEELTSYWGHLPSIVELVKFKMNYILYPYLDIELVRQAFTPQVPGNGD